MLHAADAMQTKVESVSPDMQLVDLERRFLMLGLSGFPVVEDGVLVGIVSRSDTLRMQSIERAAEEQLSDFYRSFESPARSEESATAEAAAVAARVGERVGALTVRDAMIRRVISVERDEPLREVARMMLDGHIHRLPVLDDGRLVGLVTTLDLVKLYSEGRLLEAAPEEAVTGLLGSGGSASDRAVEIRETLEARLDRLVGRHSAIEQDLRSPRNADSEERAVERENDEVLELLQGSESRSIAQVRRALSRLDAGDYGVCESCGEEVGDARQRALPEATRCLACSGAR
jgi:DnaK suppressor protein